MYTHIHLPICVFLSLFLPCLLSTHLNSYTHCAYFTLRINKNVTGRIRGSSHPTPPLLSLSVLTLLLSVKYSRTTYRIAGVFMLDWHSSRCCLVFNWVVKAANTKAEAPSSVCPFWISAQLHVLHWGDTQTLGEILCHCHLQSGPSEYNVSSTGIFIFRDLFHKQGFCSGLPENFQNKIIMIFKT